MAFIYSTCPIKMENIKNRNQNHNSFKINQKIVERRKIGTLNTNKEVTVRTGVTSGVGTAYLSGAPEFTPGF
jgi:hypothetical protein